MLEKSCVFSVLETSRGIWPLPRLCLCPSRRWTGGCWRGSRSHTCSPAPKASAMEEATCPRSWCSVWTSAHQGPDGTLCSMVSKAAKTPAASKRLPSTSASKHIQSRYCCRSRTPEATRAWICHHTKPRLTFSPVQNIMHKILTFCLPNAAQKCDTFSRWQGDNKGMSF